jgi:hypothetical protein
MMNNLFYVIIRLTRGSDNTGANFSAVFRGCRQLQFRGTMGHRFSGTKMPWFYGAKLYASKTAKIRGSEIVGPPATRAVDVVGRKRLIYLEQSSQMPFGANVWEIQPLSPSGRLEIADN